MKRRTERFAGFDISGDWKAGSQWDALDFQAPIRASAVLVDYDIEASSHPGFSATAYLGLALWGLNLDRRKFGSKCHSRNDIGSHRSRRRTMTITQC